MKPSILDVPRCLGDDPTITVRRPLHSDAANAYPILAQWHQRVLAPYGVTYDQASAEATVQQIIEQGIVVMAESTEAGMVGFLAGVLSAWPINRAQRIVSEQFFWYNRRFPRVVSLLWQAFELEAQRHGAMAVVGGAMDAFNRADMQRLYRERGYVPLDHNYLKCLNRPA